MAKKRTPTLVASIVLALALALTLALPTLARDYSSSPTPGVNAQAVLTKLFTMPFDTITPAATFTYTFTAVGVDEGSDPTGMPNLSAQVVYTGGEAATIPETGVKVVAKQSTDFLAGIGGSNDWFGEGVYTYILQETPGGIVLPGATNEGTDYSKAKYKVEFWVKEHGTGTGVYYVEYVNVMIVENFVDEYYAGSAGGEKVDPTPGGMKQVPGTTLEDDFSQVFFTNKYWMSTGGGGKDPTIAALELTKVIKGNGAKLDAYFPFDITLIQPSVIPNTNPLSVYRAYVVDADGSFVQDPGNLKLNGDYDGKDSTGIYFLFTSGVEDTRVKLTNNQTLAFVDVHVGAQVKMYEQEQTLKEYQVRYQRNGASENIQPVTGDRYGFPRTNDNGPHYLPNGTGNNVTFTNLRSGATPGGISVDNLPYIVLIGVALATLAGFAVIKLRKRAANNA